MGFWDSEIAKRRPLQAAPAQWTPPQPMIEQAPRNEEERHQALLRAAQTDSMDALRSEAEELISLPRPAASVEERFGMRMGGDIGTLPRRPGNQPAASAFVMDEADRHHERQVNAVAAQLQVQAGRAGPESERAKEAKDRAAMVQDLLKAGAWRTTIDNTPRRAATTKGVAGATVGNLGVR